jgi:GDP-L-fucose synthase
MTTVPSREQYNKVIIKNTKIYIAGHQGMVGSAVWRILVFKGYSNLIGGN